MQVLSEPRLLALYKLLIFSRTYYVKQGSGKDLTGRRVGVVISVQLVVWSGWNVYPSLTPPKLLR